MSDFDWIDALENELVENEMFHKTPTDQIKLIQILLDASNKCVSLSHSPLQLDQPNILKESTIGNIIRNQGQGQYRPLYLLKYEIPIDPTQIDQLLADEIDTSTFLKETNYTNDIHFNNVITSLQPATSLVVIYKQKKVAKASNIGKFTRHAKNNSHIKNRSTRKVGFGK